MRNIFGGKPLSLAALAMVLAACGGGGGGDTGSGGGSAAPEPTVTISLTPTSITTAQTSDLTWSSTNADQCVGFDSWSGVKATAGTLAVSSGSAGTYTYTLACTGAGGTRTLSVDLAVTAAPVTPAPTVSISASPTAITQGGATTLTWSSSYATSCTGTGAWSGAKTTNGSASVVPGSTGSLSFGLSCTGAGGSASQSATVTVTPLVAPTVNISLSPAAITVGQTSTLTWSSSGATSCTATGPATWAGSKATSGNLQVTSSVAGSYDYGLSCTGAGGTTNSNATLTASASSIATAFTVSLVAGNTGGAGVVDDTFAQSRFSSPRQIVKDSTGNYFVVDQTAHVIRKVATTGAVSTFVGEAYVPGSQNGTGSGARFRLPEGIAIDASNNLFIADSGGHCIRKVTTAGVVTTLAGSCGLSGAIDDTGTNARFNNPSGLVVDASGNVYVMDRGNFAIRKVTSAGVVSTYAGRLQTRGLSNGDSLTARLYNLGNGIVRASNGTLYFTDNHSIRYVDTSGNVDVYAGALNVSGSTDTTVATDARFLSPQGLFLDGSGNIYVADTGNSKIRKVAATGAVTSVAGKTFTFGYVDGTADAARFYEPTGVLLDGSNLVVADNRNHAIRSVTLAGVVTTLGGSPYQAGSAEGTGFAASFNSPDGIAVKSDGTVYVVDAANFVIRRIVGQTVSTFAGTKGSSGTANGALNTGRLQAPTDIAIKSDGTLVVVDGGAIRTVATDGTLATFAGAVNSDSYLDATGTTARFRKPKGVTVDASGNIYVADTGSCTIRKVDTAGVVTTLAGSNASCSVGDGTGTAARFLNPSAITVDSSGNLYVADVGSDGGSVVRKVTAAGVVTTLAGQADQPGRANGTGTAARFGEIGGLALFSDGSLMVADYGTGTIRKVTTGGVVTTVIGGDNQVGVRTGSTAPLPGQVKGIAILDSKLYLTTDHAVISAQ